MHECQRKAAIANRQKKGELAYYYAQQAYQHQKKLREANQRAAAIIYQRMLVSFLPPSKNLLKMSLSKSLNTLQYDVVQHNLSCFYNVLDLCEKQQIFATVSA